MASRSAVSSIVNVWLGGSGVAMMGSVCMADICSRG